MSTTTLGVGIYGQSQAARILSVSSARLRRWVSGYTYQTASSQQRRRPPVVVAHLPQIDRTIALSFIELMELRVVARLRTEGASLQEIRRAGDLASETFGTAYPFAAHRMYTDGKRIFAATSLAGHAADYVQLSRDRVSQIIAGGILEPFLKDLEFSDTTRLAAKWWPMGRRVPVVLDPGIAFGAPTIQGTRLTTTFVNELATDASAADIAAEYQIDLRGIEAALHFEKQLKKAA